MTVIVTSSEVKYYQGSLLISNQLSQPASSDGRWVAAENRTCNRTSDAEEVRVGCSAVKGTISYHVIAVDFLSYWLARTMSGRRLLDAIQFLNATKSVAGKHLAVRQRQLDLFTRTSSLTKGIQSQAEGLILSAQAAAALARRFNEPSPSEPPPKTSQPPPPSATSTKPEDTRSSSLFPEEARKSQRQAESQIPELGATYSGDGGLNQLGVSQQQDVFHEPSQKTSELSGLPRVKVPKEGGKDQVGIDRDANADVFHSPVSGDKAASDVGERPEKENMENLGARIAENTAEQEVRH